MAIPLTGAQGLFTRLGWMAGLINETGAAVGTAVDDRVSDIRNEFTSTNLSLVDGLYAARNAARSSFDGWRSYAFRLAEDTIIDMADTDVGGLPSRDIDTALAELVRQMAAGGDSIQRPTTLTAVVTPGTNTGDGVVIASARDSDGQTLEYLINEDINIRVTGGTAGSESLSASGPPSVAGSAYNWPVGSGTNTSITAADASSDTLVANGDFENWTGTSPATLDDWTVVTGAFGTSVVRQSTTKLSGDYSLEFVGDGSELTKIRTELGTTTPFAVIAVNLWVRASAAYTGGALAVSLVNSAGAVINDDAGNANTLTLGATLASNSSWTNVSGFFRLPEQPPSTVYLRIALTSALQSGKSLYFDRLAAVTPTQLYTGGPYVAAFSGGTDFVIGDSFTLAVTNSWTSTTGGGFAQFLDRTLGLKAKGVKIPSASSPTVSDALIT